MSSSFFLSNYYVAVENGNERMQEIAKIMLNFSGRSVKIIMNNHMVESSALNAFRGVNTG